MKRPDTSPPSPAIPEIFDRALVRRQRERAARDFSAHDFLHRRCQEDLAERLGELATQKPFKRILCLGGQKGAARRILQHAGLPAAELVVHADLARAMLDHSAQTKVANVVASDEGLPFADGSFDLVLAPLTLHFANDMAGALVQIRRCLKPGGLFLGALFGGETLSQLRTAFGKAELECEGGMSPRVIPFSDIKDFGALMQRVQFTGTVCDIDRVSVTYPRVRALMRDLRGMGLANPMVLRRKTFLRRQTLAALDRLYMDEFGDDGEIPASFQILYGKALAPE